MAQRIETASEAAFSCVRVSQSVAKNPKGNKTQTDTVDRNYVPDWEDRRQPKPDKYPRSVPSICRCSRMGRDDHKCRRCTPRRLEGRPITLNGRTGSGEADRRQVEMLEGSRAEECISDTRNHCSRDEDDNAQVVKPVPRMRDGHRVRSESVKGRAEAFGNQRDLSGHDDSS